MLTDENSLYFITAKGKAFYAQLMENPHVAISGMCGGEGTMNKKAVSIRGKAVNIGSARLKEVFEQNPYMAEIYPQEESRAAGRISHHGPVPGMPDLLQQMSPEMYRHVSETVRHPAGTLPALRELYGSMSVRGGGAKIRTE